MYRKHVKIFFLFVVYGLHVKTMLLNLYSPFYNLIIFDLFEKTINQLHQI